MFITGIDETQRVLGTGAADDEGNEFAVLSMGVNMTSDGVKWYIYVHAQEALTAEAVCIVHETGECEMADLTSTVPGTGAGLQAGVCTTAFADNEYGWLQIYGVVAGINVATSAAAHTVLNSTASAGRIDDDATAGAEVINGVTTTGAESGNSATGFLVFPMVGATL